MKKIFEFLKSNPIIVAWTIWYFTIVWFILQFIFNFDMFSYYYWHRFFHSSLHGFGGFMFGTIVYASLPMYIATTITVYRKKEFVIPVPFSKTASSIFSKIFPTKNEPVPETIAIEPEPEKTSEPEYPADLPPELRVPFKRALNRLPLTSGVSAYNQPNMSIKKALNPEPEKENSPMPIPMDFDISDEIPTDMNDSVPTFTDINFDTPIMTEKELENDTTKYLKKNNIEYETYRDYVATEKFVIYEHNDEEFWVMDGDSWFAAGKQKDSPIPELLNLAKQNNLKPVIYLASQNIMDIDNTIKNFESMGIHVIKKLDELV